MNETTQIIRDIKDFILNNNIQLSFNTFGIIDINNPKIIENVIV